MTEFLPGAPSFAFCAKGGAVPEDRRRKREAGSKTPPFAKDAKDGAPKETETFLALHGTAEDVPYKDLTVATQAEACATGAATIFRKTSG